MIVILIYKEPIGFIGICKETTDVIPFLIKESWLSEDFEVFNQETNSLMTLGEMYGENWEKELSILDLESMEDFFNEDFYFTTEEVYTNS